MKTMALMITLVVFLLAIPLGASKGAPIELKMAHFASAESKEHEIMKVGADWIEKHFPGKVKVTMYPAQTLVAAAASYESTVKGICDIALVIPVWTPGRFPKTEVIDNPPGIPSAVDGTRVYWDFYKKFLTDEWREVKLLAVYVQVPQGLHHRKKAIRTFEDIKGEKFRVTGGTARDITNAYGGTPVSMPMTEAYDALRTGVVSGIMVPFSEMKGYRLIDVCFHHTVVDIFASAFFVVLNLQKYNTLPADVKKAFDEELPTYWNMEAGKIWDRWEDIGRELVKKTPGHEFITLSPEEKKKWQERAKTVNGPWASAMEAKGLPGKKLIEEKLRAIEKYIK
jgi:TRAP-type C4-dicarboxylate transport system substrate-binding protein